MLTPSPLCRLTVRSTYERCVHSATRRLADMIRLSRRRVVLSKMTASVRTPSLETVSSSAFSFSAHFVSWKREIMDSVVFSTETEYFFVFKMNSQPTNENVVVSSKTDVMKNGVALYRLNIALCRYIQIKSDKTNCVMDEWSIIKYKPLKNKLQSSGIFDVSFMSLSVIYDVYTRRV